MSTNQNASLRTLKFLGALTVVASVYTLVRWPADTGQAHWSEWFAFYFFPAFAYAGILVLLFYGVQRFQVARGSREVVRLPLVGIFWTVAVFMAVGLLGRVTH